MNLLLRQEPGYFWDDDIGIIVVADALRCVLNTVICEVDACRVQSLLVDIVERSSIAFTKRVEVEVKASKGSSVFP